MVVSLIKIVLNSIKKYCKSQDDTCRNCIFNISHDHCVFGSPSPYEGVNPEDWELDKIDFKDKN